eukprot:355623-Chlamydomonas_euryale.AAC.8
MSTCLTAICCRQKLKNGHAARHCSKTACCICEDDSLDARTTPAPTAWHGAVFVVRVRWSPAAKAGDGPATTTRRAHRPRQMSPVPERRRSAGGARAGRKSKGLAASSGARVSRPGAWGGGAEAGCRDMILILVAPRKAEGASRGWVHHHLRAIVAIPSRSAGLRTREHPHSARSSSAARRA